MCTIASKLNSTFWMIGNATADKMTAKESEETQSFRFCANN